MKKIVTAALLWGVYKGRKSSLVEWCHRVTFESKSGRTHAQTVTIIAGDIHLPLDFKFYNDPVTYRMTSREGKIVILKPGLVPGWVKAI